MEVFVYFNLHKKKWSVKCWRTKKVVAHLDEIYLKDCTFKVSQKGRERVLREKRKNVHAGIRGTTTEAFSLPDSRSVTYNPYKYDSFVFADTESKIEKADRVHMIKKKVYV